jgi:hypothetical protein
MHIAKYKVVNDLLTVVEEYPLEELKNAMNN